MTVVSRHVSRAPAAGNIHSAFRRSAPSRPVHEVAADIAQLSKWTSGRSLRLAEPIESAVEHWSSEYSTALRVGSGIAPVWGVAVPTLGEVRRSAQGHADARTSRAPARSACPGGRRASWPAVAPVAGERGATIGVRHVRARLRRADSRACSSSPPRAPRAGCERARREQACGTRERPAPPTRRPPWRLRALQHPVRDIVEALGLHDPDRTPSAGEHHGPAHRPRSVLGQPQGERRAVLRRRGAGRDHRDVVGGREAGDDRVAGDSEVVEARR